MRIAVMGTGGVGGYFGAKLAQAGNDVAFVARGAHLAAMREHGLRVESAAGDILVSPVHATDDPSSIAPVDVAMFCVKLWDVERGARQIGPLVARGGVVIPFQNGIDSAEVLTRELGASHVLGGVAYIAASIRSPGVITHVGSMARLRIGAFDERLSPPARTFVDACRAAGVEAELAPDIRRALWEKFVFLNALSGLTCLARQPLGVVRSDPDLRATFETSMRETIAVAKSQGVDLGDDFVARQLRALDGLPAEMRASMLGDLASGHRLEAPWLCGRVAALAREAGIAAPVNATIYAGLKPYLNGAT
jgi:2-dehydropantoate 2-reductase